MDHTGLDHGVGKHRADRVREPGQPIAAGDQDVLHATVTQVGDDLGPELRRLGVGDPEPEGVFTALDVHANGQVADLGGDHTLVLDPQPQPVPIQDRIHLIERAGLPQRDLVGDDLGHVGNQFP